MNPSDVGPFFGNLMEHFLFSNSYCRFELVPCPTDWVWNWLHCVFFCQFCDVTKVTMIHRKDLAKFGYKLNMKIVFKKILLYFYYLLRPWIEIWQVFLNFGWILAVENLKKHLKLALLIFNTAFWIHPLLSEPLCF